MTIQPTPNAVVDEPTLRVFSRTQIKRSADPAAIGELAITQTSVRWVPDSESNQPWAVPFLDISLHAISTEETPKCIYAQVGDECTEVRFIPEEEGMLQEIYAAFCAGAERNSDEEENDMGSMAGMGEGDADGSLSRRADAFDQMLDTSLLRYSNAEEEEGNDHNEASGNGD